MQHLSSLDVDERLAADSNDCRRKILTTCTWPVVRCVSYMDKVRTRKMRVRCMFERCRNYSYKARVSTKTSHIRTPDALHTSNKPILPESGARGEGAVMDNIATPGSRWYTPCISKRTFHDAKSFNYPAHYCVETCSTD